MEILRIHTLGDLRLALDDRAVTDLVPLKGRALVAHLAVTGGAVERSRLAGLLWTDLPEASARANLRLTLSKLRSCVPHLRADRTSVWLEQSWWCDASALERLTTDRDHAATVLDLVRGAFLDGLELSGADLFNEWASAQRARIRSTALALLDGVARRALTDGATTTGVAAARRILELDPCNEQAHRWLMRLFAAAGQPSAALAQFDTCMHVLYEELGERPAEETAALADEIRAGAIMDPVRLPAVPRPATSFVGRGAELDHLRRLFDDPHCRLVTMVGPGGIGKTRIALELAATHTAGGGDPAFVSFAGTPPAGSAHVGELVLTTLAAGLGIALVARRAPFDVIVEHLAGRDLLLAVDNLEHLTGAGDALGRLLDHAHGLRVLATSRRRLGVGAEWVVQLAGMAVPPDGATDDLLSYDAVRLFCERARAAGVGEQLDLVAVAAVCRAVDGMPLAIELAARRAMTVPLPEICRRLGHELDLLGGTADSDPRHRSMRAALDWSWELLQPAVARSLARLSVFPGGFTADAAAAVADVEVAHLSELAEQSLLRLRADGRYDMHQLVRQYAADHLARDPADAAGIAARHAGWVATAMKRADARAALDLDDVRAATGWMLERAEVDRLADYLEHLVELYRRRSYWAELRSVTEAALERSGLAGHVRAEWLGVVSQAHRNVGKPVDAITRAHDALVALGRAVPDSRSRRLRWVARHGATLIAWRAGLVRTERRRQQAGVLSRRLLSLGELYYVAGQMERIAPMTIGLFVESRISADPATVAAADGFVAVSMTVAGHQGLARRYRDRAVDGAGRVDAHAAADTFLTAAVVTLAFGPFEHVRELTARTVELSRRAALHRTEDLALLLEAVALYHTGAYDKALQVTDDVVDRARQRGAIGAHMWALIIWAESGLRLGRTDEAAHRARLTLQLADRVEQRIDRVRAMVVLARVALAEQRWDDAERLVVEASHELAARPTFASYAVDGHAGVAEVALDLLDGTHGDPRRLEDIARRDAATLGAYVRAVPIAAPRQYQVEARLARMRGRERAARRLLERGLREAERLCMSWEVAEARRLLSHDTSDAPPAPTHHL